MNERFSAREVKRLIGVFFGFGILVGITVSIGYAYLQ